ncbi:MAG: lysylphosphatidylglycerol synthase transmembrane domain-containing protein [Anaerolineaceae bacterium]|nr:lysylphosphatidylglycerol synthase transmembrane domain-containing protein [Anaerolineaceae bacterium]
MRSWRIWAGIVISAVFLYAALRGLALGEVWSFVVAANYLWLLPGIAIYFVGVYVRAWRWHFLLRPVKRLPTRSLWAVLTIGYMGNNIFPARAGEILRAVILKDRSQVSVSASLATIIVERVFDGVIMLAFIFLNLSTLSGLPPDSTFAVTMQRIAVWGSAAFFGALLIFLLAAMFPRVSERATGWMIDHLLPDRWRERVHSLTLRFLEGLKSLRSPLDVLLLFTLSALVWLLETCKYWFVMQAFPFEVSFATLMMMNGTVNLVASIPSAPRYIGTFDAPGIALLSAYGVPGEIAAGYTLVLHAALWLPITLLGAYYYIRQPLRWGGRELKGMATANAAAGKENPG